MVKTLIVSFSITLIVRAPCFGESNVNSTIVYGKSAYGELVYTNSKNRVYIVTESSGMSCIDIELLKRNALAGDEHAIHNLARRYDMGLGVEKDKEEAFRLYSILANQGRVAGLMWLGRYYRSDDSGDHQDFERSLYWFSKAASKNELLAMVEISGLYAYGGMNLPVDKQAADEWLAKAEATVDLGDDCFGAYRLGREYETGKIINRDHQKALKYYEIAANRGHPEAGFKVAEAYFKGKGTAVKLDKARLWYMQSKVHPTCKLDKANYFASKFPVTERESVLEWAEAVNSGMK